MDWGKILDEILAGSPWALIIVLGFWHWRTKKQHEKEIAKKDGVIKAQAEHVAGLNTEFRTTVLEMAGHVETVMAKSSKETLKLQEKRVSEVVGMQKEFTTTMLELNGTLVELKTAVRARGD